MEFREPLTAALSLPPVAGFQAVVGTRCRAFVGPHSISPAPSTPLPTRPRDRADNPAAVAEVRRRIPSRAHPVRPLTSAATGARVTRPLAPIVPGRASQPLFTPPAQCGPASRAPAGVAADVRRRIPSHAHPIRRLTSAATTFPSSLTAFRRQSPTSRRLDSLFGRPYFLCRRADSLCRRAYFLCRRADSLCRRLGFMLRSQDTSIGASKSPIPEAIFRIPASTFHVPAATTTYSSTQPRPCRTRKPFNSACLNTKPIH